MNSKGKRYSIFDSVLLALSAVLALTHASSWRSKRTLSLEGRLAPSHKKTAQPEDLLYRDLERLLHLHGNKKVASIKSKSSESISRIEDCGDTIVNRRAYCSDIDDTFLLEVCENDTCGECSEPELTFLSVTECGVVNSLPDFRFSCENGDLIKTSCETGDSTVLSDFCFEDDLCDDVIDDDYSIGDCTGFTKWGCTDGTIIYGSGCDSSCALDSCEVSFIAETFAPLQPYLSCEETPVGARVVCNGETLDIIDCTTGEIVRGDNFNEVACECETENDDELAACSDFTSLGCVDDAVTYGVSCRSCDIDECAVRLNTENFEAFSSFLSCDDVGSDVRLQCNNNLLEIISCDSNIVVRADSDSRLTCGCNDNDDVNIDVDEDEDETPDVVVVFVSRVISSRITIRGITLEVASARRSVFIQVIAVLAGVNEAQVTIRFISSGRRRLDDTLSDVVVEYLIQAEGTETEIEELADKMEAYDESDFITALRDADSTFQSAEVSGVDAVSVSEEAPADSSGDSNGDSSGGSKSKKSSDSSTTTIVVVVVLLLLIVIAAFIFCCCCYKSKTGAPRQQTQEEGQIYEVVEIRDPKLPMAPTENHIPVASIVSPGAPSTHV